MSIYPKLAANRVTAVKERVCFVLMPFSRDLRVVHAAIKDVCDTLNMICERADDIYSQRPIFASILDSILEAEIIIADLTGKNPNVFYETGIAHSFREPQSVILVAQSLDDVPFDLRHLPIVLYKMENMQKFEIELEKRISHSREATRGVNFAMSYLFPLNFQSHEIKSFIDYANELSNAFFLNLARCLDSGNSTKSYELSEREIDSVFKTLQLSAEASNGRWKRICDYLKLEILSTEVRFEVMRRRCLAHLQQTVVSQYEIIDRDGDFFTAELCFKLIDRDLAKTKAINWIISYLHNPRMGNIDVVRYKIETFIVESEDADINASLLALLSSSTASIRENVADMVGQKSIAKAGKFLEGALKVEENPYAARSLITAIARQNVAGAAPIIVDWVRRHRNQWWEEPISNTLQRVSLETIRKLAPNSQDLYELQTIFSSWNSENNE